jgi:hypothetical protein
LTGWSPEYVPDPDTLASPDSVCLGLALALARAQPAWQGPRLLVVPQESGAGRSGHTATRTALSLEALCSALAGPCPSPTKWVWDLGTGGFLELTV